MTTVVLTRPEADSERLSRTLRDQGVDSLVIPIMSIAGIAASEQPAVAAVSDKTLFIFISANAVRFGLPRLRAELDGHRSATTIAVGSKTRDALQAEGFNALMPARSDSEGLLAMPELSGALLPDVVIVKGEGGRELLGEELKRRGARVTEWCCYRRCWPEVDLSVLRDVDSSFVFQASSGEMVSRLSELLTGERQEDLFQSPVIVPSERVAALATALGWGRVIRAEDAGDRAFTVALKQLSGVGVDT